MLFTPGILAPALFMQLLVQDDRCVKESTFHHFWHVSFQQERWKHIFAGFSRIENFDIGKCWRFRTRDEFFIFLDLCDGFGTYYKGSCYKKLPQGLSFNLANAQCLVQGANLPVVTNTNEALFLQEKIKVSLFSFWMILQMKIQSIQKS